MREIKFRAWDSVKHEMRLSPDELRHLGSWFDAHRFPGLEDGTTFLMQFTGLKDKNGKEIYEGDVVKTDRYSVGLQVVQWDRFAYFLNDNYRKEFIDATGQAHEVKGNVYENPELLKI